MDTRDAMMVLRHDAVLRGMWDIATVYGWSAIRLGDELVAANLRNLANHRRLPPACD